MNCQRLNTEGMVRYVLILENLCKSYIFKVQTFIDALDVFRMGKTFKAVSRDTNKENFVDSFKYNYCIS